MSIRKHSRQFLRLALFGAAALVGTSTLIVSAAQAQNFSQPRIIELRAPGAPGNVFVQAPVEAKFWVGIFCRPVDESLRVQLKLPAEQGIVIDGIAPNSPADKAGLMRHDVLLFAGDKPLANPNDLLQCVEACGEVKLTFKLVRSGEEKSIDVTPATRPELPAGEAFQLPRQNLDSLRTWVDKLNDPTHGPLHLRGFGPGVMFAQRELPKLPDGVSIQINKTGQEPAKIVVTQGEEKWELTDVPEELAKLPATIRPAVESMLGRGLLPFQVRVPGPADGEKSEQPSPSAMPDESAESVEQRLKQVERRLEKLLQQLEQK